MNTVKTLLKKLEGFKPYRIKRYEDGQYIFRFWTTWVGTPQWGSGNTIEEALKDAVQRAQTSLQCYIDINRARAVTAEKQLQKFKEAVGT